MEKLIKSVSQLSIDYTKATDQKYLKEHGQFFTINNEILKGLLDDYTPGDGTLAILEPSCGTGMIVAECLRFGWDCVIDGIELDANLVKRTKSLFANENNVRIREGDFLKDTHNEKYDLIIGNPPYFELKKEKIDANQFGEVMCGRTNIYSLFIYKSIKLLKDGGELRFVIPRTFLSGKFFSKVREFVHRECEILDIVKFEGNNLFSKALQSVIIIKLKKTKHVSDSFVWKVNGMIYFVEKAKALQLEDTTCISDLGCTVKTGSIIWNKYKSQLQDSPADAIPLIMSTNLKGNELKFDSNTHSQKKQYMKKTTTNERFIEKGPFIVVNRIIGHPPRLNVVLVTCDSKEYFIENHVNVIKGPLPSLRKIVQSLRSEGTLQFLREFAGSTQISQYELQHVIPI